MGHLSVLLSIFAVAFLIVQSESAENCPLASKVYGCSPKCLQNFDCHQGKVCCPNSCNSKSCVERAPYGSGGSDKDKYSQTGGAGVYCNNVKCNSFEVCKLDPSTKRMKCQRA